MTQEEYEQKKQECWEDFWEAIKVSRIDCNYWRQLFEDTYHTAFNKGFALAHGKEYTDAVFGEQEKDEVKPTESGRFEEPKHHIPDPAKMMDGIIKDGFEAHNRLHIAAMALQGIISNSDLYQYYIEYWKLSNSTKPIRQVLAEVSLKVADALLEEARKSPTR